MGKASHRKGRTTTGGSSSAAKGRMVERIVSLMHEGPDVTVKRNVRLPVRGSSTRKREIDVLITGGLSGYPVRIAIECKNERESIGAPRIDQFVGKLDDVGIPPQYGIYVSASGYTSGAIERAQAAGIRPLTLRGLTHDKLESEVRAALQSIVYLLLAVRELRMDVTEATRDPDPRPIFYDRNGRVCGSLNDLVWWAWQDGQIESKIGMSDLELTVPPEWNYQEGGKIVGVATARATVQVLGVIVTIGGQVKEHALVDASQDKVEKWHAEVAFDTGQRTYPVTVVSTEEELETALKGTAATRLSLGRIRLPRIRFNIMYWPPSERVMRTLWGLRRAYEDGLLAEEPTFTFEQLEGTDLRAIFEPIWEHYHGLRGEADPC